MEWKIIHIDETDSTNRWLRERRTDEVLTNGRGDEGRRAVCVWADYQTAGRGCGTNRWESERGQNLLFSMLLHPGDIPAARQFHISMVASLAVVEALDQYMGDLSIKWPNDIYWRNGKIAGMLIENRLLGNSIRDSIVGIGLNVNQRVFHSDAPNPVSMWQICGQETDRHQLLLDILHQVERYMEHSVERDVRTQYLARLYRRRGFHPYVDKAGAFMAELLTVEDDGRLLLRDEDGRERRYAFKEVTFI